MVEKQMKNGWKMRQNNVVVKNTEITNNRNK